ncbi:MAG TPA: RdgB/HAM1 family non-canonical purine NTP pyrophosphatase [Bacteroidetes bacterium]|uniref:dITP/XTP pyrophosphatase n=1 Tax=candidate division TA06 bacterium TaxID=2250710 RepID=A0A660SC00_UNCT6|nr:MAG: non-canonical purine NTP pyrophosphatase, RdgB/HAM1 family [candidate division TA06 bacterium]HHD82673.1 RdgB/HAM1 family non-canonical purine NTP pyrophosphatase [Bacteroidota bacterium]
MKLIAATNNKDKIVEIKKELEGSGIEILTLNDISFHNNIEEDGITLEENAIKKALTIFNFAGIQCFADDTGLFVDLLNGMPGVYSARFAGESASYSDNVDKLLRELITASNAPKWDAYFRTVIAYIDENRSLKLFEGITKGYIIRKPSGKGGFGYDPVFEVASLGKTYAEMSLDEKNSVSHRGKALRAFVSYLRGVAQSG